MIERTPVEGLIMQIVSSFPDEAIQERFDRSGRTQIPGILDRARLQTLSKAVSDIENWMLVTHLGGRHIMLDARQMAAIDGARATDFERHVFEQAEQGFQYLYEAYPLYGKWHAGTLREEAPVLADIFEYLNSDEFLDPLRDLLNAPEIGFVDAQLTRYGKGHFLTEHDDSEDKGNRIAAYTLTLSEGWKAAWGGQLQFFDEAGGVTESLVPRFNTLSVFRVPQPHHVSCVSPFAPRDRISITGWLRAGEDPGPKGVG